MITPTTTDVTLPSGKQAVIKRGKGRDLLNASRAASDQEEVQFALIAQLTVIDGVQLGVEDVLDLDLHDLTVLQNIIGGKAPTPSSTTSST